MFENLKTLSKGNIKVMLISVLLAFLTILAYSDVIEHEFINFDDDIYVTENKMVQRGVTWESIKWAFNFDAKDKPYWQPIAWISHMVDFQIYGLDSGMHHLMNLLFHVLNAILLFVTLSWMTGDIWKCAFVATLFALHPINVESVAWVAERKNVLSTFFWMLCMLVYNRYINTMKYKDYLLLCFVFAIGLMTKPVLVVLPFVLLLLDFWPLGRIEIGYIHCYLSRKQTLSFLLAEKIPLWALSCFSIALSISTTKVISTESLPLTLRIENALVTYVKYLFTLFFPWNLSVFYPFPSSLPFCLVSASALFLILMSIFIFIASKHRPYLLIGWLWYLGALAPVSGLMQAGLWPEMANRFAYIPFIGIYVIVGWSLIDFKKWLRCTNRTIALAAALFVVTLGAMTWLQVKYWSNSVALFENASRIAPDSYTVQNNLCVALSRRGLLEEAKKHCTKAVRISPDSYSAHINLGNVLAKGGRIEEAKKHYSIALGISPGKGFEVHNNVGAALITAKRYKDAVYHLNLALKINPNYTDARKNLETALKRINIKSE